MDELFEAILSNPFLLILIIGGLISFFRGSSGKSDQESQQPSGRPTQRSQTYSQSESNKSTRSEMSDTEHSTNMSALSVEEQRDEQLERLKKQLNTNEHQVSPHPSKNKTKVVHSHESSYKYHEFKKDMKRNLTKQGLIDSIVMAEILGPPRARKPYRSIIDERKNL